MSRVSWSAALALCLPLAICAQVPPSPAAAPPARRVVSLLPAATEILLALGAGDALVARTEGDRDPVLAPLRSVGQVLTPNLEVLASVRPDLVIAWPDADLAAVTRVVERGDGRLERIAIDRLGDLEPAIRRLGAWVGRARAADSLAASVAATLRLAREAGAAVATPSGARRPRVLWVVWSDPIVVAGPGTFIADVIDVAGGANAASDAGAPWPRLGAESLLATGADVLVWPEGDGVFPAAELGRRARWSSLTAVRAGRVIVVDPDRVHVPGPEIAEVALDLAHALTGLVTP